jgi:hypothetical protein
MPPLPRLNRPGDADERLKKREKNRPPPSSQLLLVEAQPDTINKIVLARASEAKRRRRMGNLFFRLFQLNRSQGCQASCIDVWH